MGQIGTEMAEQFWGGEAWCARGAPERLDQPLSNLVSQQGEAVPKADKGYPESTLQLPLSPLTPLWSCPIGSPAPSCGHHSPKRTVGEGQGGLPGRPRIRKPSPGRTWALLSCQVARADFKELCRRGVGPFSLSPEAWDQSQEGGSGRGQEDLPACLRLPVIGQNGSGWRQVSPGTPPALSALPPFCQKAWMHLGCFCPKRLISFPHAGENRPASPVLTGAERPGPNHSCTQPTAHNGKTWVERAQCRTVFLGLPVMGTVLGRPK